MHEFCRSEAVNKQFFEQLKTLENTVLPQKSNEKRANEGWRKNCNKFVSKKSVMVKKKKEKKELHKS